MHTRHATSGIIALGLATALSLGLSLGLAPLSPAAPQTKVTAGAAAAIALEIDPVHSTLIFRIKHLNASYAYGRFNEISGTATFDEAASSTVSLDVQVKTASVDTNSAARDKHLRSAEFFDVEKFPTMTFKSTSAKKTGDHTFNVTGDLSFHGVTKSITVPLTHTGSGDHPIAGHCVGFETVFTIKRSEYGMGAYVEGGVIGDEVTLTISLEATPPKKG